MAQAAARGEGEGEWGPCCGDALFSSHPSAGDDPHTNARPRQARGGCDSLATAITRSQYISSHCPQLAFFVQHQGEGQGEGGS
jgi:hypothetical protein